MKPSTQRTLSLFGGLALLVAALVVYYNFISPLYIETQKLRGELSSKESFFANQQLVIGQVQQLLSQFKTSAQLQQVVSSILPTVNDSVSLMHQFNTIARINGIGVKSLKVGVEPIRPGGLGVAQLTASVFGGYEGFKKFLATLENNVRIMDLVRLGIDPSSSDPNNYNYSVVINSYYQQ